MLQVERQLIEEFEHEDTGELRGSLTIGASTGPGAHMVPLLLCELQREHPSVRVALMVSDTQTVIEQVAGRELELGVVGRSGGTARSCSSRSLGTRSCSPCPGA